MNPFSYARSESISEAIAALASKEASQFIGGGTNLLDLMKVGVSHPQHLIDINHLPLDELTLLPDGGLRIGALVSNSDVAYHAEIEKRYPLLAQSILSGATPQLRNMATVGGNLLQRTRCQYFYDTSSPCNKRKKGSGCSALHGYNRMHAILGTSQACIAVHPSDMCIALVVLEAVVQTRGRDGDRSIPIAAFHRLPGDAPEIDTNLHSDEIILSVDLPSQGFHKNFSYIKVRDRASYAFALVSVAVGMELNEERIEDVRIALGGVAHKPWRVPEAEHTLKDARLKEADFPRAAERILVDSIGYGFNNFKIPLAKRAIIRALKQAAGLEGKA